ncbi:hypothetical protein, partial [Prevotella sp. HMSC073D09]|uniref:hypothetical protein n=1 Tax=Prevotella sp. HMSC073D09 TaxID=1739459 RepID=UPI001AEF82A7
SKGRGEWYALCVARLLLVNLLSASLTPSPNQPTPSPSPRGEGSEMLCLLNACYWSTHLLVNSSTGQLVNWSTCELVNLFIRLLINFFVHFSAKVLTLWLRFFPPIAYLAQKIDSREGWF